MQQLTGQNEQHVETTEEKYYAHLKTQRKYYSDRSKQYKRNYQGFLIFSAVGALLVPVLIATPEVPKILPTVLSALVSIAIAVENIFHYGDNWRTFRQTLEGLRQEQILYDNHVGPYVDAEEPFMLFVERTMTIMNSENSIYFEVNRQMNKDSKANQTTIVAKK